MPLWVVPALAFVACIISGWLAYRSGDHAAKVCAWGTLLIWTVANASWLYDAVWLFPIVDWYVGITVMALSWYNPQPWIRLYIWMIGVRLILHVLNMVTGSLFFEAYAWALLVTYAGLVVAVGGGRDGISRIRDLRSRLSLLRGQWSARKEGRLTRGA